MSNFIFFTFLTGFSDSLNSPNLDENGLEHVQIRIDWKVLLPLRFIHHDPPKHSCLFEKKNTINIFKRSSFWGSRGDKIALTKIALFSISPTFYEKLLHRYSFAKKLQSQVNRENCAEHFRTKKLVKLTPDVSLVRVQNNFSSFEGTIPMSHQEMTTCKSMLWRLKSITHES